jgi:hypothetical protein
MIAATMQTIKPQMAIKNRTFVAQPASRSIVTPMIGARKLYAEDRIV